MAGLLAVFIGTLVAIVLSASYALVLRELRQINANLEQLIELATSRRKIDAFKIVVNSAWQRKTRRGNRGAYRDRCAGAIKGRLAFPWRDRC